MKLQWTHREVRLCSKNGTSFFSCVFPKRLITVNKHYRLIRLIPHSWIRFTKFPTGQRNALLAGFIDTLRCVFFVMRTFLTKSFVFLPEFRFKTNRQCQKQSSILLFPRHAPYRYQAKAVDFYYYFHCLLIASCNLGFSGLCWKRVAQ